MITVGTVLLFSLQGAACCLI